MVRILSILLLGSLAMHSAMAADRYILVRKIQGMERLPGAMGRQLETITLQVSARQPDFQLLLSAADTPTQSSLNVVAVESEVARTTDGFRFEARLLDLKTKKLLNKASQDHVREEDLLRLFQGALESLFIPLRKFPSDKTPAPSEKDARSRQKPRPSGTQVNVPDHHTLDFKKRVRELKFGVDTQIVKAAEEQKNEDKEKANAQKNSTAVPPINPAAISEMPFDQQSRSTGKSWPARHRFSLGQDFRTVSSDYLVSTTSKAAVLNLSASGHMPFWLDGRGAVSYDAAYGRLLSGPAETPPLIQLGAYGTWLAPGWSASLGLFRDTTFFVNLPSPGAGLETNSLTSTWIRIKGETIVEYRGPWRLEGAFGVPMQAETDYSALEKPGSWQGNHLQLSVTAPYQYKKFEAALAFERINLSTQGERPFTYNESRIGLSVRRSL